MNWYKNKHYKRFVALACAFAMIIAMLLPMVSFASFANESPTAENFSGKKVALQTGTIWDSVADKHFSPIEKLYFGEDAMIIEAVKNGKADFALFDDSMIRTILREGDYPELAVIPIPAEMFDSSLGVLAGKANTDIISSYNDFLAQAKADGTIDDMLHRWIDGEDYTMPEIPLIGENGTLIVATEDAIAPWAFSKGGETIGFEIENMRRFAQYLGRDVRFVTMPFASIIPYVVSGKADIGAASFAITEERANSVLFSEPYTNTGGMILYADKQQTAQSSYKDYIGKKFAVMNGSLYDVVATEKFNAKEKLYLPNILDEINNVSLGKVDAALVDEILAKTNIASGGFADIATITVPDDSLNFEFAVFGIKQDVVDKYNAWLKLARTDGTFDEMKSRWIDDFDIHMSVPEIPLTGENGTWEFAINSSFAPFVFLGDGNAWSGFDIEQLTRFATHYGMKAKFVEMDFSALLPYAASGKCDLASTIYRTNERAEKYIFGDVTFVAPTVLVVKKADTAELGNESVSFFKWLKDGFENNLLKENRYQLVINGLVITFQISVLSLLFGTIIGAFHAFMLTRKNKICEWVAKIYSALIRGTPMVVLLMISYYIVFGKSDVSPLLIAVAAFALVQGASVGENLYGAIGTVDSVEIEAARSLGYSAVGAFKLVTLPQAVKRALPSYLSSFLELVKATAIVGYIAIQDLSRAGDIIRSRTYDAYFPLIFVAVVYWAVMGIMVFAFGQILKLANRRAAVK